MKTALIPLLLISINVYVPWRLGKLFELSYKWPICLLFILIVFATFFLMPLIVKHDTVLVSIIYMTLTTWVGLFIYLFCFTLIFEIINLFYKLPTFVSGITIIIATLLVGIYSFINASSFKIANLNIPIKNLKTDIKIAQISDVHLGISRGKSFLEKIVKETNDWNPDFIVITGDIADSKIALTKNMLEPLKDLQSPTYFVYGNHDVYVGINSIFSKMKESNITILQNDIVTTSGIKLIGLNYMKADDSVYDPHQVTKDTIKDILPTLDLSGKDPKIVLHHGPYGVEYMNEYKVDLILAGHTHGGQIFPATVLAKLMFPYNKGLTNYQDTYIYVSKGAGTFFPKMRLGSHNEITFITLTNKR